MEHFIFFDGTPKEISWVIESNSEITNQKREHHEIYLDKVNDEQSKCIALHVGMFWGIGRFIIKNTDTVHVMIDSEKLYDVFSKGMISDDIFMKRRIWFYNQLVNQRKLKMVYHLIKKDENKAHNLL